VVTRKSSLDPAQAEALNEGFSAAVDEDIAEVNRLAALLGTESVEVLKKPALAEQLAKVVNLDVRTVQNRLYGDGIPVRLVDRRHFISAVGRWLAQRIDALGGHLSRDYETFVIPVAETDQEAIATSSALSQPAADESGSIGGLHPWDEWAAVRIGAWLADRDEPAHVDNAHHYSSVFRQDMLDYESGDFYSIRRLTGRNVSPNPTHGLLYRESSERKYCFEDAGVRAFDFATKQPLAVEPESPSRTLAHTHAFKILFKTPVQPGHPFDVIYNIRLPHELEDLARDVEIMSISLTRIALGPAKLAFNVVLDFQPTSVAAYNLTDARQFRLSPGKAPTVSAYQPKAWWEQLDVFGIQWPAGVCPHIIKWGTAAPEGRMYIINFRGPGLPPSPPRTRA
jgi:hypothetical protein